MARYTVEYEWDIEGADKHGDIIDHDFSDTLKGLASRAELDVDHFADDIVRNELCLVRSMGNDDEGIVERSWAYVTPQGLPAETDNGSKVPQKYLKEFDRNREWVFKFAEQPD